MNKNIMSSYMSLKSGRLLFQFIVLVGHNFGSWAFGLFSTRTKLKQH